MNYGKQDLSAVILFALLCHFWVCVINLLLGCSGAHLGFLFPALLLLLRLDALGLWGKCYCLPGRTYREKTLAPSR